MIKSSLEKTINEQINAELYSAYLYLSMAAYFENMNLKGFAHWMNVQAQEEVGHAMRFYKYLFERGGRVILEAVEKPPAEWNSPLDVFENAYKHEQKVTSLINNLVTAAKSENDYATETMLQWFVEEQVEEEASALEIVQKLKLIKDSPQGLMMLDSQAAQRKP